MQLIEHENRVGFLKLGRLSKEIISLLDLSINEQDIIFWYDRITHIRKHQLEFKDEREFANFINHIPEVVNHPDYVVLHPDHMSIKFIKRFECNMVVAVRISISGRLHVRTAFTITQNKLENYILKNSAKRCLQHIDIE